MFNFIVNVYTFFMNTSPASTICDDTPVLEGADAAMTPRQLRQQALADVRRELVLDAARSAFFELGMEKTSIREIARRAGYTPGAIYSYFSSKEELYGTLLSESLTRLIERTDTAANAHHSSLKRVRSSALAFFDFYRANPRDLDLGFYLFQGLQPRGLTPELNHELNASLRRALMPIERALCDLGMSASQAVAEVTALFAHIVGLLLLSHTGRIRMFGQEAAVLLEKYLDHLLHRATVSGK